MGQRYTAISVARLVHTLVTNASLTRLRSTSGLGCTLAAKSRLAHANSAASAATSTMQALPVAVPAPTQTQPQRAADVAARVAKLSQQQVQSNADLVAQLKGKLILAPLTRGGNLPFRRLCSEYGAEVTMSGVARLLTAGGPKSILLLLTAEMVFARQLLRGNPIEKTRLRKADNEPCFGFQIATNVIDEGVRAAKMAAEAGASWVDLNCGCPIFEASKRGLGAIQLRKPAKLARLVAGIAEGSPIPLTVKVRTGATGTKTNVDQVVEALQEAGVAAVSVHGRTMEQRYKKAADWGLVSQVAATSGLPLIGNGDIITHQEVKRRLETSGCLAVMAGRGALIKPWLFEEWRTRRELHPSARERVAIYRRLVVLMKEHFGDDAKGRTKAWSFLPWHFDFFCRYRPFPQSVYGQRMAEGLPLLGLRQELAVPELGETLDDLPLLERLLRCENTTAHSEIAALMWDSSSDDEIVTSLERLADSHLRAWEDELYNNDRQELQAAQG